MLRAVRLITPQRHNLQALAPKITQMVLLCSIFCLGKKMRDAYPVSMAGPMQHAGIAPLSVRLLLRREFVPMPQHLSPVVSNEVLQIQITEI
jgi:hypothetical protein